MKLLKRLRAASLITAALSVPLTVLAGDVRIAVLKSRQTPQYDAAFEGFRQALAEKGIECEYLAYDLRLDEAEGRRVCSSIASTGPTLVLTLGSMATETAQRNIRGVPIVFSMVLNPVDNGFVASLQSPGADLTGASMDIPLREQFRRLKEIVPDAKRIGVVYDPAETGKVVEQAKAAARDLGLELDARPVSTAGEVPGALMRLAGSIDALWAVADSTVFSIKGTQFVMLFTIKNRIPFMGISSSFVKAGALMALYTDDADIGRQAGETAASILDGTPPSEIPVTVPRRAALALNTAVAQQIGLSLQRETIETAGQVFP